MLLPYKQREAVQAQSGPPEIRRPAHIGQLLTGSQTATPHAASFP